MLRSCAVWALAALALALPRVALAAEPSTASSALPISLEYVGCADLDRAELEKLLSIEFQTLNVQPATPLERVRVACGPSVARVTLANDAEANEVELAATAPAAWPRLLALSVSEIVIGARARLVPPPAAPRSTPPVMPELRPSPPPPASPTRDARLFVGGSLRRAMRSGTWLAGPELGLEYDWTRHFSVAADVRAELANTKTSVADVHWVTTSAAVMALVGGEVGALRLSLGPGLCVGYLRWFPSVRAANATGHVVSGAWAGPELALRAQYDFSARWFASASIDSGIVTWPVKGLLNGEQRLVDGGGAWVSGVLALGARF